MVTARSASRSWITDALLAALPELIPELVFMEALANNVVEGVPAGRAVGLTTKLIVVAPAATVRLPMLQVTFAPTWLRPPGQEANPPVTVAPAGSVTFNTTLVASDGPLFCTCRS